MTRGGGTVKIGFGEVGVEGAIGVAELLKAAKSAIGGVGGAYYVGIVEETEDVDVGEVLLNGVEGGMKGKGKQPRAVRVALSAPVGRGYGVEGIDVSVQGEVREGIAEAGG